MNLTNQVKTTIETLKHISTKKSPKILKIQKRLSLQPSKIVNLQLRHH